ncbi:MAG: DUF2442 domain-containing protein [Bacteroidetes bacterium]|nr:DUF2442 domain-containing protein [Bacteroidota bacterium]
MFLEVKKATCLQDYKLRLEFNEGTAMFVGREDELNGKVFEPLKNIEYLQNFLIRYNTIEWENGADFAPEFLFGIGKKL